MKHLQHPKLAKWIAVLLAVLCGTVAILGALITAFTNEMNLYKKPLDKIITVQQKRLQKYYSIKIIDSKEKQKVFPVLPNMEYGIVKSDNGTLKNLNLADNNNYIYTNFYKTSPTNSSYKLHFISDDSSFYQIENSTLISSLMGNSLGEVENCSLSTKHYTPIERIVYSKEDRIFYFETSQYSFPISHISIDSMYTSTAKNISKDSLEYHENFTLNTSTGQYESDSGNCKQLDTTQYPKWPHVHFEDYKFYIDSIDAIHADDLLPIKSNIQNMTLVTDFPESAEIDNLKIDTGKTITAANNTNPFLYYESASDLAKKTYWVVSNVRKDIDTTSTDLFAKQKVFLTKLYEFRYISIGLTLLCGLGFLLSLSFLWLIIKQAQKTETLLISKRHKIPLLLYLGIIGILIFGSICKINSTLQKLYDATYSGHIACPLILLFSLLCVALVVLLWTNLTTRYYGNILWKYSVTSRLMPKIKKLVQICQTHTTILTKGGVIFIFACLIELLFMYLMLLINEDTLEMLFFGWIIIKLIGLAVFYLILIQLKRLQNGGKCLAEGNLHIKLNTKKMFWEFKKHGDYLNQIGNGMSIALEERLRSERFKTELITNVSHDIKTPLTSIINYVDLLQKEDITPESQKEYISVLERQSARLKKLIEDLIEASKASAGTLPVNLEECDIDILLTQTAGEFEEKFSANQLELIVQKQENPIHIRVDSRHLWRIFDNLMNNICKYSQPGTRVYINQVIESDKVCILFLNTSKYALNISGEELIERFVRGDTSRNTEGSGLGLSIARNLAELMNGTLRICVEGDLFKAILSFPRETKESSVSTLAAPKEPESPFAKPD